MQSDQVTDYIFGRENFSEESLNSYNYKFESLSYSTKSYIYNLGTIFYIYFIILIFPILAGLITLIHKNLLTNKTLKKIVDLCWRKLTPGLYLRLFIESNLELLIISYIQLTAVPESSSRVDYF
jgi:hypothetical protein